MRPYTAAISRLVFPLHEKLKGHDTVALGYIGDARGVDALCKIVLDEEDRYPMAAREAAVEALGYLGDRSARPWRVALTMGANYCARTKTLTSADGSGVLDLR